MTHDFASLLIKDATGLGLLEGLEMLTEEEHIEDWGPKVAAAYRFLMREFGKLFG